MEGQQQTYLLVAVQRNGFSIEAKAVAPLLLLLVCGSELRFIEKEEEVVLGALRTTMPIFIDLGKEDIW
ncbi:hypothetical protein RIF29_13665 [Crotalaria pallida]|uniref:Uncharacterized protein n=1 Tax=Crotalaria pallida TaxID=3830 RepID=A0AAN9IPS8_CROPI